MDVFWIPVVTSIGFFVALTVIVLAVVRGKSERARVRAEVQAKMIERFGTAPEFIEFLRSAEGKEFMGSIEKVQERSALERVVGGFSRATVLAFLGIGFLAMNFFEDTRFAGFIIAGFILLGLGIGFVVSALVALKLSRTWGLVGPTHRAEP